MGLFDRISRVVRAELNSSKGAYGQSYLNEGRALVAGGAVAGASIGKAGILAGGTGYSLGAVSLAALGALSGAALYEALRSLLENDASSTSAAALGTVVGAATSATIGGVGVAVGGSAIGVGMASMAAGGAVVGLGLVGLNRLLQQGIDPEKLLDRAILQMEAESQQARQAVIQVVATQKRLQQQYGQAQAEANQEPASVKNLKRNLILLDAKIAEAKVMRTSLKARIAIAKVNGQLPSTASQMSAGMPMGSFTRREEEVLQMEARSQAVAELAGADLESLFARLESGSDVDDELAAMKEALLQPSQSRFLPASPSSTNNPPRDAVVDEELEELKRQLDSL